MHLHPFAGRRPTIAPDAFVAPGARLIGDVAIGPRASIWYNCVLRGDLNRIVVGACTNIQDGAIVHVDSGTRGGNGFATLIGEDCLVGHLAILHGCTLARGAFVGMGAIVMDGCTIGEEAMLAAGSLLTPGKAVPAGELWHGRPARFQRPLTPAERLANAAATGAYAELASAHAASLSAAANGLQP